MSDNDELAAVIERLTHIISEEEDRILGSGSMPFLTLRQVYYLDVIHDMENPTATEIARTAGVKKPTATAVINALTEKGILKKEHSRNDGRVHYIRLTKKGRRIASLHQKAHEIFAGKVLAALGRDEIKELTILLKKVFGG